MKALDDIRVVELAFYYPGPLCGLLLSDMGAEVVKVESPDGDPMRPMGAGAGKTSGPSFRLVNRGKKSVVMDLKTGQGRESFLELLARSDVLLQVLRPEVMERLGLGREAVAGANTSIIHCVLSGFGATGPYASRAGHDINYEALAGLVSLCGTRGGELAVPPVPIADLTGALHATIAIVAAIREHDRNPGRAGRFIDVSLAEGSVFANALNIAGSRFPEEKSRPLGRLLNGLYAAYNVFRSRDGRWFALGAIEPKFWVGFCEAAGRPDLMGRQLDSSAVEEVAALFASRDASFWLEIARTRDVCLEPVLDLDQVASHPQHVARGIFYDIDGDTHVAIPGMDPPDGPGRKVPELGEHTGELLTR